MTEVERDVLSALLELEAAVQSMTATGAKPNLLPHFTRLDQLTQQLPPTADPQLQHYLRKKSYEKARLHLQGRGAENAQGACRQD